MWVRKEIEEYIMVFGIYNNSLYMLKVVKVVQKVKIKWIEFENLRTGLKIERVNFSQHFHRLQILEK